MSQHQSSMVNLAGNSSHHPHSVMVWQPMKWRDALMLYMYQEAVSSNTKPRSTPWRWVQ